MSFHHSPSEHIQQIRNDLRERYSGGFPILKELLQNADDAGAVIPGGEASQCLIVLCPNGLPESKHALLKGAGLCLINDGDFTPGDANSINSYGLSNRGGQAGTAGKFGLGLKSIFHWAEAFFYFSPQTFKSDGEEQSHPFDLQNPWFNRYTDKGLHPAWDAEWIGTGDRTGTQKADFSAFTKFAGAMVGKTRWFGLWIPFRTEEQTKDVPPIEKLFPKPDYHDLFGERWLERVVEALPLLRRIRTVRFGIWRDGGFVEECSAMLVAQSSRMCFGTASQVSPAFEDQSVTGTVKVSGSQNGDNEAGYFGLEQLLGALSIDPWISHKYWPERFVQLEDGGEKQVKEKAAPHGTSIFIRRRMRRDSTLKVQLAVFLPLGEPEVVKCIGEWSYSLFLHGFFFVDSGRRHIEKFANLPANLTLEAVTSESQITQFWNRTLMEKVVAPLVLPSLDAFVRQEHMQPEEVETLVRSLQKSETLGQINRWMCCGQRFVHHLIASGSPWALETCREQDGKFLRWVELPTPQFLEAELFGLLPALSDLCSRVSVSLRGKPHLADHKPERLSDVELAELLSGVAVSAFADARQLAFILMLILEANQPSSESPLSMCLVKLANQLVSHQLPEDETLHDLWRKFFQRLPAKALIRLPCDSTKVVAEIARVLAEGNLPVAVLWQDFREAEGQGTLKWEALLPVLRSLGVLSLTDEPAIRQRSEIVLRLLQACAARPQNWADAIADLLLFHACQAGCKARAAGVAEFRVAHVEERLFTGGDSWAADLVKAAPEVKPMLVEKAITDILGLTASDCGDAACVKLLRSAPSFAADFARRKPLFERLLRQAQPNDAESWAALRCLLHVQVSQWEQTATLFRESGDQPVFVTLARKALDAAGQLWRLIPVHVAKQLGLNAEQERQLNLVNTSASYVEALVREVGPEKVDCTDLSRDDCDLLLRQFDGVDVLRPLNIHDTLDGRRVRIDEHTYVDDGSFTSLPPEFDQLVTRIHPNPCYARFTSSELVANLGWEAVIRIALNQPQPESYCHTILTAVGTLGTLRTELKAVVLESRWVKLADGTAVAPCVLLHVPGAEAELDLLPPKVLAGRVPLQRLDQAVRARDRFETFKHRVLPPVADALKAVADLLKPHSTYSTGITNEWSPDSTRDWVQTLGDAPAGTLPLGVLVKAFYGSEQVRDFVPAFLCELGGTLSTVAYAVILKHLAAGNKAPGGENRAAFNRVFVRYLCAIAENGHGFARSVLKSKDVKLLTAQGEWKSPDQIAFRTNGICAADTLCDEQATALDLVRPQQQSQAAQAVPVAGAVPPAQQSCAAVLQSYFAKWAGVPRPLIGVFIGMLGGDSNVQKLAQSFLGAHDLATLREVLCSFDGHPARLANEIGSHHFRCSIVTGDRIHWWSVIGTTFEARRGGVLTSLLVGTGPDAFVRTGNPFEISFRLVELDGNPAATGVQTLQQLLQETTKQVLTFVYCRRNFPLDQVWNRFAQTGQLHILIAQQFLLRNAIALLRQAGAGSSEHLKPILKRWDEANNRRAEERLSRNLPRHARQMEEDAIDQLTRAFENNEVHAEILRFVRKTVERFRYDERSVALELWQNADDAYVQLELLRPPQPGDGPASFVIVQNGSTLAFLHWGRPINQFRGETGFNGQDAGFGRDLQNMLTLNLSDKDSESGPAVTGKFGLGFKSVLLVSDAPKVLSGEVDFVIRGGVYPKQLTPSDRSRLDHYITEHASDRTTAGTVFELQLAPGQSPKPVLKQFLELLPVLLAFSRRIKQVVSGREGLSACWSESALQGHEGINFGLLASPLAGADRALLLRGEQTTLLLGMDAYGFIPLPKSVPVFWVTAPTQETPGYGFAVNGPFEPDAGRTQLASNSKKNFDLTRELGHVLSTRLVGLWQGVQTNWKAFRDQLRIDQGADACSFWESLWQVLGVHFSHTCSSDDTAVFAKLACRILWNSEADGMWRFYAACAALPTGLWGHHRALTRLGEVHFVAFGALDRESVFRAVSGWKEFKQRLAVGAICSGSQVASVLERLGVSLREAKKVHLATVVEWELGKEQRADPELAVHLGELITPEFMTQLEKGQPGEREESEHKRLVELLRDVSFQAADSSWHKACKLVVAALATGVAKDEVMRAAFAPHECQLNPAYTGTALQFFLASRPRLEADVEQMAEWVLKASDQTTQVAALHYLLDGGLRYALAEKLRPQRDTEKWLWKLDAFAWFKTEFTDNQRHELLAHVLKLFEEQFRTFTGTEQGLEFENQQQPQKHIWTVKELWEWWEQQRMPNGDYTLEGEANWGMFHGKPIQHEKERQEELKRLLLLPATSEGKADGNALWYRLFGYACFVSAGRTMTELRRFWLQRLDPARFWQRTSEGGFSERTRDIFERAVTAEFDNLNAGGEQAYFWRRVFYDLRKMHWMVWENEFPAVLLEMVQQGHGGHLLQFLRTGHLPGPDQLRWIGTFGQSADTPLRFIIRELVRLEVITDEAVRPYAFYVCRPVLRALCKIGWIPDEESPFSGEDWLAELAKDPEYGDKLRPYFDIPLLHMGITHRGGKMPMLPR